jgi:hypothetical protein
MAGWKWLYHNLGSSLVYAECIYIGISTLAIRALCMLVVVLVSSIDLCHLQFFLLNFLYKSISLPAYTTNYYLLTVCVACYKHLSLAGPSTAYAIAKITCLRSS